ncbi:ATP-binding cassette subfamily B protein/ATP-binding cassette subfamily C protein [Thermosporothrix hazakensis]|jgi:ABC-type multidrug transport system fused ATPase/permease subunit|uniref:ATP-binding cassette subfamily B protein/ATP-binding cassette subfamily C protein n=1 Tax=Thermosporothrix hazakensis TaxID=644383 RepID=A0A326U7F3_THEHA|nr:ATP-binding cassette subfamily B protein/ATP-binding cassette subfamily C protein [Thermosporothrix hazakensis]
MSSVMRLLLWHQVYSISISFSLLFSDYTVIHAVKGVPLVLSFAGYRAWLLRYVRPHMRQVLLLTLLLGGSIILKVVQPQLVRFFIDTARETGPFQFLLVLALLFLGVALLAQVVSLAETYVAENIGVRATNMLRSDLLAHCLRLDPDFHSVHTPGELTQRIDGDVSTLGSFFSRFVLDIAGNVVLLLVILTLSFFVDWRIGLCLLFGSLLLLGALLLLRDVGVKGWREVSAADAAISGFLEERLSGLEDIRAHNAHTYVLRRLAERAVQRLRATWKASLLGMTGFGVAEILFTLVLAVSLGLGGYLYMQGQISLGVIYVIYAYTQLLQQPLDALAHEMRSFQEATASILRSQEILATEQKIQDGRGATLPAGPLSLSFERITFHYSEDADPVLHELSFTVDAGKKLGLVGRTGSGKTTITRLLFRLYDPTAGRICLNGIDIRELAVTDLRKRIGMVTQDIQLFHASIRDNLTFFDESIPDHRVEEALALVGLAAWYKRQPEGLSTLLAPDNTGLSAGEAQLLAFARVFLQDPQIVILDEASSRLDPATEHEIERAMTRLLEGRTAILIAHRLHTLHLVDDILILSDGRLSEYGERRRLAEDERSQFARLLRMGMEKLV